MRELTDALGSATVALSVLAGLHIQSVTFERRAPEHSEVVFSVGTATETTTLPLGELRYRLGTALVSAVVPKVSLPAQSPPAETLQAFIGPPFVLLAPVFGVRLLELRVGGFRPPSVLLDLTGSPEEIDLSDFRELIREQVRAETPEPPTSGLVIDPDAVARASRAAERGDWEGVLREVGHWPGPAAMLLRTSEAQEMDPEAHALVAKALGLAGEAYLHQGASDWSGELFRLGIQWSHDGPVAADLFYRLGVQSMDARRFGHALGLLRRAHALGASEREVVQRLAECYLESDKPLAAMACARRGRRLGVTTEHLHAIEERAAERLGEPWRRFVALVEGAPARAT